jgi:hypothetical protein
MSPITEAHRTQIRLLIDRARRQQLGLPEAQPDTGHGSISRYNKGRCRCPHCTAVAREVRARHRARAAA